MTGFRWRFLWPVMLVAICLVILCVFTAISLFHQQATVARVFHENVSSRRVAVELEECLLDLVALEKARIEEVAPLHDRVREHILAIHEVADEVEEDRLVGLMTIGYADYLRRWRALPPPGDPRHEAAVRETTRFLETNVLARCTEFRLYNGFRLEEITAEHERVLNQLGWGMAGVGGLGTVAGVVLGFGVARALSRSIRRLQVQLRDAAGKLRPALPEIVLTGEGSFGELHNEIDRLTEGIEGVVRELHQREREVVRAEQLASAGQLAAGVGHEIRNPLTSIKMLVQAALEDGDQPGLSPEDLRVIVGEIRRMERSLQTFLEFARPPKPERHELDLLVLLATVLGLIRGRAEKQKVTTRLDAPSVPVALTADAGQLRQVFLNLVLNALDAMPNGGILTILVRTANAQVEIEVADTGTGIPRDVMPRLFQPFVSTKETGLGLGLVISQRIVEDHGGGMGAANRTGGGASFFVRLPLKGED